MDRPTATAPRQRPGLSRDRIVEAAVRLADEGGVDAISMRKIAQRLGVEAMSLYNHVANKEALLDGMVDVVVAEIDPPDTGVDWRTVIRRRILSAREMLLRHPWASHVLETRTTMSPTVMEYMESMAATMRRGGFSVDLTHHAIHALGSRILGFAQELYAESAQPAADGPDMAAMMEQLAASFPHLAEVAGKVSHDEASTVGSGCDDQFEFEFGLDLILDGLDRLRAASDR